MLHLGRGRTTDPVPRFSRCYFNYVCRVSVRHCHCPIIPSPVPICPHFSCLVEGNFGLSILVSTIGKRNVSPRYVSMGKGRGSRKPRVPQISRSLHANRLRRVAPSPPSHLTSSISSSRPLLHVVLLLLLFLRIQFSWMHRGVWQRSCGFLLVIFERRCARMGEGRKEGEGCFFGATVVRPDTFYRAVNAGCGGLVRTVELFYGPRQIYRARRRRLSLSSAPLPPQSSLAHDRLVSTPRSSIPTVFSARLDPANRTDLCGFNPENPSKIVAGDKSAALPLTRPVLRIFVSRTSLSSSFPSLSFLYSICFFENVFLVFVFLDLSGHCPTRI